MTNTLETIVAAMPGHDGTTYVSKAMGKAFKGLGIDKVDSDTYDQSRWTALFDMLNDPQIFDATIVEVEDIDVWVVSMIPGLAAEDLADQQGL